jgi:mRNA interferase HigB
MRIIKESAIRGYWRLHPDAEPALATWIAASRAANWANLMDVRAEFPAADGVKVASGNTVTVFNIGGNKFRLVVSINYKWGIIYVREFLTHAEYSKDFWKRRH